MNCPICNKEYVFISSTHAKLHGYTPKEMKKIYPLILISRLDGKKMPESQKNKISNSITGKNNPFYGKKHTKETIDKIKKTMSSIDGKHNKIVKSKQYKELFSILMSGKGNSFYGKKHSVETRCEMSKRKCELLSTGKLNLANNLRGRKGWYFSIKNNSSFYYDSLLEKYRMQQLDNDNDVETWTKKHGIKIPYVKNKINSYYVPDFLINYVNGNVILEEIKGYDIFSELKKIALKKYCKNNSLQYRWINQNELQGYNTWRKKIK